MGITRKKTPHNKNVQPPCFFVPCAKYFDSSKRFLTATVDKTVAFFFVLHIVATTKTCFTTAKVYFFNKVNIGMK